MKRVSFCNCLVTHMELPSRLFIVKVCTHSLEKTMMYSHLLDFLLPILLYVLDEYYAVGLCFATISLDFMFMYTSSYVVDGYYACWLLLLLLFLKVGDGHNLFLKFTFLANWNWSENWVFPYFYCLWLTKQLRERERECNIGSTFVYLILDRS